MKALVGAFNQEKALVGAFSVILQPVVEPMDRFTALEGTLIWNHVPIPDRCCLMAVVLRTLMTAASLLGCLATVVGGVVVPQSCQLNSRDFSQYSEKAPTCY